MIKKTFFFYLICEILSNFYIFAQENLISNKYSINFVGPSYKKGSQNVKTITELKNAIYEYENSIKQVSNVNISSLEIEVLIFGEEVIIWNEFSFKIKIEAQLDFEDFIDEKKYILTIRSQSLNISANINIGCIVEFKGFSHVYFSNIIFIPIPSFLLSAIFDDPANYFPTIFIYAYYINISNCQMIYQDSTLILVERYILSNDNVDSIYQTYGQPTNLLTFKLSSYFETTIINFKIHKIEINIKFSILLGYFSVFQLSGKSHLKNISFESFAIENAHSLIKLSLDTSTDIIFEHITFENSYFKDTNFIKQNEGLHIKNLSINHLLIENTLIINKNFISLLNLENKGVFFQDIVIKNSRFYSIDSSFSIFDFPKINSFQNLYFSNNTLYGAQIFSFSIKSSSYIQEVINFSSFWILNNNILLVKPQTSFFLETDFFNKQAYVVNFLNILFFSNFNKETNCYTQKIVDIDLFFGVNIKFIDNQKIGGFFLENIAAIDISNFTMINSNRNDEIRQYVPLFLTNVYRSVSLQNVKMKNLYFDSGLIIIVNNIENLEERIIIFKKISIENIIGYSSSLSSSIYIKCFEKWNIFINDSQFSNISLSDNSPYSGSSGGILVDSPLSYFVIHQTIFENLTTTGISNVFYGHLASLLIADSNFRYGNYFSVSNHSNNFLSNDGSFLNVLVFEIFINNSNFIGAYSYNGGVFFIENNFHQTNFTVCNSFFEKVFALSNGGIIYVYKKTHEPIFITVINCVFNQFASCETGGLLYLESPAPPTIIIKKSKFIQFNAQQGSIFKVNAGHIFIFGSFFSHNFDAFPSETLIYFENTNKIDYFQKSVIGGLLILIQGILQSSDNTFHELGSNTLKYIDPLILSCEDCTFYDFQSNYINLNVSNNGLFEFYQDSFAVIEKIYLNNLKAEKINKTSYTIGFDSSVVDHDPIIDIIDSLVFISFSYFKDLNLNENFYLISAIKSNLTLISSIFNMNIAFGPLNTVQDSHLLLQNCAFENNLMLSNAGCFYVYFSYAEIKNSFFTNNSVQNGFGGALCFLQEYNSVYFLKSFIENTSFINNSALVGGAIFYQEKDLLLPSFNIFQNNSAVYFGKNFYSNPYFLCFVEKNETLIFMCRENKENIINFRSGAVLPNLYIQLLDEEGNAIIRSNNLIDFILYEFDFKIDIIINPLNEDGKNLIYSINSSRKIYDIKLNEKNLFPIENLILIGHPTTSVTLNFSSLFIKSYSNEIQKANYSISFTVEFRNCIIGEYFQLSTGICYVCPEKTYSFNPNKEYCNTCPIGLVCKGGAITIVSTNYWRYDNCSDNVFLCYKNPEACVGGESEEDNLCAQGHIGARCESCDLKGIFWKNPYARTSSLGCVKCDEIIYNYVILALLSCFNFLSMALSIKGTIENINMQLKLRVIKVFSRFGMFRANKNESSSLIKIYFSYFQIIQVLSVLNLKYSTWLNFFGTGTPTNSALYSMDCLIGLFVTSIPYLHVKLLLALIIPFIYLFVFTFGYLLFIEKSKHHKKFSMLYTVCLFTLLYFQPSIVENIISVLSCVRLGDESYIKADMAYKCSDQSYKIYSFLIGLPALFFWMLGTPGFILYRLIKNRKDLQRLAKYIRYGYLYDEYLIFYWEFIRMYKKILITMIISFFEAEIFIKGLLVLLVIAVYQQLLFKKNPYKTKILNKIDKLNCSICFCSIFFGILSYQNEYQSLVNISYFTILAINCIFNVIMGKNIISAYSHNFDDIITKLHRKLVGLFPFVAYAFPIYPEIKTKSHWIKIRKLVSRYLRERERVRNQKRSEGINEQEMYQLTLFDYDPEIVGIKKNNCITKQKLFKDKKSKNNTESLDDESLNETPFDYIINQNKAYEIERSMIKFGINEIDSSFRDLTKKRILKKF